MNPPFFCPKSPNGRHHFTTNGNCLHGCDISQVELSGGVKKVSIENTLSSLIRSPEKQEKSPRSQWSDLVGRFTRAYNRGTNRPITEKFMAMKLAPIKKAEGLPYLEYFYHECDKADNFGRYFNWKTSTKITQN